ncbi:hypothetical protein MA16_Dca020007 [Dendrobium catenatum]|uniref:Uncharacterized protein n=1 Tax=Dendrobium catenatum TaxID=906689 RepID=A0A2I0X9F6_9ASPA|nr:hypothetical protein MA16_Dca020007 [Dendrobium catenatum]
MNQVAHPSTINKCVEKLCIHINLQYQLYLRSLSPPSTKLRQHDIEFMSFGS